MSNRIKFSCATLIYGTRRAILDGFETIHLSGYANTAIRQSSFL